MAVVVPTSIARPVALERVGPITSAQLGALVETDAFIRSRLRVLAAHGGEDFATSSTSYSFVTKERPVTASDNASGTLRVAHYATNATVRVTVTDGTASGSAVTVASGLQLITDTIDVTSLSGTDWRLSIEIKDDSGAGAALHSSVIQELAHVAGTIA